VFLIVAVALLMPRAPTDHLDFHHHGHMPRSSNHDTHYVPAQHGASHGAGHEEDGGDGDGEEGHHAPADADADATTHTAPDDDPEVGRCTPEGLDTRLERAWSTC
jgi:hypothetical protein